MADMVTYRGWSRLRRMVLEEKLIALVLKLATWKMALTIIRREILSADAGQYAHIWNRVLQLAMARIHVLEREVNTLLPGSRFTLEPPIKPR